MYNVVWANPDLNIREIGQLPVEKALHSELPELGPVSSHTIPEGLPHPHPFHMFTNLCKEVFFFLSFWP